MFRIEYILVKENMYAIQWMLFPPTKNKNGKIHGQE
jgi:hypothetical protein